MLRNTSCQIFCRENRHDSWKWRAHEVASLVCVHSPSCHLWAAPNTASARSTSKGVYSSDKHFQVHPFLCSSLFAFLFLLPDFLWWNNLINHISSINLPTRQVGSLFKRLICWAQQLVRTEPVSLSCFDVSHAADVGGWGARCAGCLSSLTIFVAWWVKRRTWLESRQRWLWSRGRPAINQPRQRARRCSFSVAAAFTVNQICLLKETALAVLRHRNIVPSVRSLIEEFKGGRIAVFCTVWAWLLFNHRSSQWQNMWWQCTIIVVCIMQLLYYHY